MSKNTVDVTDATFSTDVLESDKTVLVSGRVEIDAARGLARQGWSVIEHVRYDGAPPLL